MQSDGNNLKFNWQEIYCNSNVDHSWALKVFHFSKNYYKILIAI